MKMKFCSVFCPLLILLFVNVGNGQDWQWVNPLPQGNTLNAVKFFAPGSAIAVGNATTVMRTLDGGKNWKIINNITGISRQLNGLSFCGEKGIAVGDSGTVIITKDSGSTWYRQESNTDKNLYSVFSVDDSLAIAVGENGTIIRTTDFGKNWQLQENETTNTILNAVVLVDSFAIAVGFNSGEIVVSYDMGMTWAPQEHPAHAHFFDVSFLSTIYGFVISNSGQVYLTKNGGATWIQQQLDTRANLSAIHFYNGGKGMIASASELFMTEDSGKTWHRVSGGVDRGLFALDIEKNGAGIAVGLAGTITTKPYDTENWTPRSHGLTWGLFDLAFTNADTGIATASKDNIHYASNLVYTVDGGTTWVLMADTVFGDIYAIDFFDEKYGSVIGQDFFRTEDGGKTWKKQDSPLYQVQFRDVLHVSPDSIFVVGAHRIMVTTDGGMNWAEQESGGIPGDELNAIFFTNSRHGVAVSEDGLVFRTTDGGETWIVKNISRESLQDVYFTDANHGVIVGDDGFIVHTADGGDSWVQVNEGKDMLKSVDFYNENTGFAVGQQGAILRTDDGGLSWSRESANIDEWLFEVVVKDANTIFAVGWNGTILKRAEGIVSVNKINETNNSSILCIQNYPNPFNPSTTIQFNLPQETYVKLQIFDMLGRHVQTLVNREMRAGIHYAEWDGRNSRGEEVAAGSYLARLHTGESSQSIRLSLIR